MHPSVRPSIHPSFSHSELARLFHSLMLCHVMLHKQPVSYHFNHAVFPHTQSVLGWGQPGVLTAANVCLHNDFHVF